MSFSWSSRILEPSLSSSTNFSLALFRRASVLDLSFAVSRSFSARRNWSVTCAFAPTSCFRWTINFSTWSESAATFLPVSFASASAFWRWSFSALPLANSSVALCFSARTSSPAASAPRSSARSDVFSSSEWRNFPRSFAISPSRRLMAAATASLPSGVGSDGAGGASDGSSEATLRFEMIVFDWRPSSSMLRSRSSTSWSVVTFLYASAVFSPREMRPTRYFLVDSASATNVSRSAVTLVSVSASNRFFSPSPTIFVDRS